jgi:negative regulator of flagellin synthesis FlgM
MVGGRCVDRIGTADRKTWSAIMSDVTPLNGVSSPALSPLARAGYKEATATVGPIRLADRVELSEASQYISRLSKKNDVRTELVDRVKAQIAEGKYETPDKIDAALDELLSDLA